MFSDHNRTWTAATAALQALVWDADLHVRDAYLLSADAVLALLRAHRSLVALFVAGVSERAVNRLIHGPEDSKHGLLCCIIADLLFCCHFRYSALSTSGCRY